MTTQRQSKVKLALSEWRVTCQSPPYNPLQDQRQTSRLKTQIFDVYVRIVKIDSIIETEIRPGSSPGGSSVGDLCFGDQPEDLLLSAASASKIPPITMSKLYIGNLPVDTNENSLRQLFFEQNLPCLNILVKRGGYAFVDCPDQSSADKAIDKLNGE